MYLSGFAPKQSKLHASLAFCLKPPLHVLATLDLEHQDDYPSVAAVELIWVRSIPDKEKQVKKAEKSGRRRNKSFNIGASSTNRTESGCLCFVFCEFFSI